MTQTQRFGSTRRPRTWLWGRLAAAILVLLATGAMAACGAGTEGTYPDYCYEKDADALPTWRGTIFFVETSVLEGERAPKQAVISGTATSTHPHKFISFNLAEKSRDLPWCAGLWGSPEISVHVLITVDAVGGGTLIVTVHDENRHRVCGQNHIKGKRIFAYTTNNGLCALRPVA